MICRTREMLVPGCGANGAPLQVSVVNPGGFCKDATRIPGGGEARRGKSTSVVTGKELQDHGTWDMGHGLGCEMQVLQVLASQSVWRMSHIIAINLINSNED